MLEIGSIEWRDEWCDEWCDECVVSIHLVTTKQYGKCMESVWKRCIKCMEVYTYMLTNYDLEELCDTYDVALRGNIKVIISYSVNSQRPK